MSSTLSPQKTSSRSRRLKRAAVSVGCLAVAGVALAFSWHLCFVNAGGLGGVIADVATLCALISLERIWLCAASGICYSRADGSCPMCGVKVPHRRTGVVCVHRNP